jgi:branched chain amino acid efflux pump
MISFSDRDMLVIGTIAISALVTYGLRAGGLLMAGWLPRTGRFKHFMEALPGTILLSLVAPGIVSAGPWGGVAALCTAFCAWKTRNLFVAMAVGVVIVAVSRQF